MTKNELKIVFMGTPEFAVATLQALLENEFQVKAVITAPDRAAGRGMKLKQSAVKEFALKHNIPVLQPTNLKNKAFQEELKSFEADVQIVVAFRMLPESVWDMPEHGTINIHGSLLPNYRGAAPIHWAVINGEKESGVSTFKLKHKIDTGDILLQSAVPIEDDDTTGDVHDKLMVEGAQLLIKTLDKLLDGSLEAQAQVFSPTDKKAPKIFKKDCEINWENDCASIHNFIRGLNPYPTAYTFIDGQTLKVHKASKLIEAHDLAPGKIKTDGKSFLHFACKNGFIVCHEVQLQGKKRMLVEDFLRGWKEKE